MHAAVCSIDLRLPGAHTLKDKRHHVRSIVDGLRHRFGVSVAEVGWTDLVGRAEIGVAVVSGTPALVTAVLDDVERFVWSRPDIEVISCERVWAETPEVVR